LNTKNDNPKVFILEDDENQRKFTKLILENKFNFTVMEADNGKDGLEILSREIPSLIILDLMMPEMNGRDFLKTIRMSEETKNIPVIVCTCVADKNVVMEMVNEGISEYLVKPVNPPKLINKINEVLKKLEDHNLVKDTN
jgi:response regulator RpfG family c-di-GMP phosphodiesterase